MPPNVICTYTAVAMRRSLVSDLMRSFESKMCWLSCSLVWYVQVTSGWPDEVKVKVIWVQTVAVSGSLSANCKVFENIQLHTTSVFDQPSPRSRNWSPPESASIKHIPKSARSACVQHLASVLRSICCRSKFNQQTEWLNWSGTI